jgi:23S rRNA (uracil1939-C5)-methyltransferase/tRNA (uracil-5-)-methyltransferase
MLTVTTKFAYEGHVEHPPKRGATLLLRVTPFEGVCTNAREWVHESVAGLKLRFKAGEFFQNNPYVLSKMVEYVVK